jgi:hypothetical protein
LTRPARRRPRPGGTVVAALLALAVPLAAAGCGSDKPEEPGTFVPGATSGGDPAGPGATSTTSGAKASRSDPLAERVFRVDPEPRTATERAAVRALEGYLDGLVTAFATNDVGRSGIRRYAAPDLYEDARRLVAGQVRDGFVLYGPYTFTIEPRPSSGGVAVVGVCVNQSRTRRHDARTDRPGRRNDTPYVQLRYTITRQESRWLVTSYSGEPANSCPA